MVTWIAFVTGVALLAILALLPLLVLFAVCRLACWIIVLPFKILGAMVGAVVGLGLGVLGLLAGGLALGLGGMLLLAGLAAPLLPVLVFVALVYLLIRLLSPRPRAA